MSVGVYEALRSAVIREGWELDSAKAGVVHKSERITAVRRRWINADTARLLIPGRGWVSTVASDGRQILAQLRFEVRRPLPVYSSPELATQPGNRLDDNLLLWSGDVHAALEIRDDRSAVELKLSSRKHAGHRRGWVTMHGLEQLPTDPHTDAEPPLSDTESPGSQLAGHFNAFDSAGRWTARPTVPTAALLFSLRWGDGNDDDDNTLFVPTTEEIIPLEELPGVGHRATLLGSGSFGAVFQSQFRGRQVAVKRCSVMKPSHHDQAQPAERTDVWEVDRERLIALNREVAMMRRMVGVDHVVQYVGVAQDERCCYIVMECASGGSLRTRLLRSTSEVEHDEPLDAQIGRGRRRSKAPSLHAPSVEAPVLALRWCERATVAYKLARALTAMHAAGIIHRDLKAENVLLDAAGEPLIADFGLGQADAYATESTDESVAAPEPEPSPESTLTGAEAMGRHQSAPSRILSSRSGSFVPTPSLTLPSSENSSDLEGQQRYRQRNMTLLCGTPRFMAPEVVLGGEYDASVDLYSFGVLMVELLFRDVEACLATARQMEHAEQQEEMLAKLQLQLNAELHKQRVLSYQMQTLEGQSDDDRLGLVPAETDTEVEMQEVFEADYSQDAVPATDQLPWRGLRLILREQMQVNEHEPAAVTTESKHRALALAERCCAASASQRPTAADVALELETIAQLARSADTAAHARRGKYLRAFSTRVNCGDRSAAMDDPRPPVVHPPPDSDSDDEDACTPRADAIQSARNIEVQARCSAERSLDAEQREHEHLDRSIESVLSEQDETTAALREHLSSKTNNISISLPRSSSGEYVPATRWAAAHGRG
eukprot:COSAG02_NODE_6367_length_3621_cov_3.797842_1_plen_831_part_00